MPGNQLQYQGLFKVLIVPQTTPVFSQTVNNIFIKRRFQYQGLFVVHPDIAAPTLIKDPIYRGVIAFPR